MRKPLVITLAALLMISLFAGAAMALPLVQSQGWAELDYTVSVSGAPYVITHAEAGIDIQTGTPVATDHHGTDVDANAEIPGYSWGHAEVDPDYIYASSFASAEGESWGYGAAFAGLTFTGSGIVDIDYEFTGRIQADSSVDFGSAVSIATLWIVIDPVYSPGGAIVDCADDYWYGDIMMVSGTDAQLRTLSDSGIFSYDFGPGDHEILLSVDSYNNAAVPIPGAAWLLGPGLIGLAGLRKRFFR